MEFRNLSVFMKVGLFSIIIFALGACGSSSSSLPGAQPVDTPPQVTRTTPATNATDGVPGVITVVFSENVNGINENTFLVRQAGASADLTGIVGYDIPSRTATFTNTSDNLMLFNTSYTVTLKSDVILDDSDKPLDSGQTTTDYIFTFNTGVTPIVNISAGLVGDVKQHFIAVDSNGRAASAWKQQDSNNVRIYASLFENGKWQPATTLVDIPFALRSNDVSLKGLVSNGNGFAVQWSRDDSSTMLTHNYVSIYTDGVGGGGSWAGQDSAINTGAGDASELVLATNGNEYVTVWVQSNKILSRFYTSTWSTITDVATTNSASDLQLTSDGSGYGLVWLDEGINADTMGNSEPVTAVYFDFYDGNWSMQPTRVSLQASKQGAGVLVEPEGMLDFSYAPKISSNRIHYAVTWYGQDVNNKSRVFSSVMTDIINNSRDIVWNGPLRLNTKGNPSNNIIVASGDGYLVTWDAYDINATTDSYIYYSPFFPDLTFSGKGDWYTQQGPANNTSSTAASPIPFSTSSGNAMVWTKTNSGLNDGDAVGWVYLDLNNPPLTGTISATVLSKTSLGKISGLSINGSGNQFIASWVQGQNTAPGNPTPPGIAYVNRYNGTTWEIDATDPMNPIPLPLPLEGTTPTTASSNVKTVPLGNGHYMATWLKEVTLGGVKRLDSKFVQAP